MTSTLVSDYLAGLRRRLPTAIAGEAAAGRIEPCEHHLASGAGDLEAARAALADFGDLAVVAGEFTRQAPGRRIAQCLLATGPVAGPCWATALILGHAWTWPVPATVQVSMGALLLGVGAQLAAATSWHSYRPTRLTAAASLFILALDAAAVTAVMVAASALTPALGIAVTVSLSRIAFTAWMLPGLALPLKPGRESFLWTPSA